MPSKLNESRLNTLISQLPEDRLDIYRWIRGRHGKNLSDLMRVTAELANSDLTDNLLSVGRSVKEGHVTKNHLKELPGVLFLAKGSSGGVKAWSEDGTCYSIIKTSVIKRDTGRAAGEDMSDNEKITLNALSRIFKEVRESDPQFVKAELAKRERLAETFRRQERLKNIPPLSSDFQTALKQLVDWSEDLNELSEALSPSMFDLSDRNRTRLGRATMALDGFESGGSETTYLYRALPQGKTIESGDWVTRNREYAERHAQYSEDPLVVEEIEAYGDEVYWAQADENEFVYIKRGTWAVTSVQELWDSLRNPEIEEPVVNALDNQGVDTSKRYFHGTAAPFNKFDLTYATDAEGLRAGLGWGPKKFYFTESAAAASNFAEYSQIVGQGNSQNIHAVHLKMEKSIEENDYRERLNSAMKENGLNREEALSALDAEIKAQGYDSIVSESGGVAVYSPDQVISVFDSRLHLDRKKDHSQIEDLFIAHSVSERKLKHNIQHFGAELLSPSLSLSAHYSKDFGDINFIFPESLTERNDVEIYGSDVYSPRHPESIPKVNRDKLKSLNALLREADIESVLPPLEIQDVEVYDSSSALANTSLFRIYALSVSGVKIAPPIKKLNLHTQELIELLGTESLGNLLKSRDAVNIVNTYYQGQIDQYVEQATKNDTDKNEISENCEMLNESFFDPSGDVKKSILFKELRESQDERSSGSVDLRKYRELIDAKIADLRIDGIIVEMARSVVSDLASSYYFKRSSDLDGNYRKIAYTKKNVLKELNENTRGGENFNYGAGSVRAAFSPEYDSIEDAKHASSRLVDQESFKKHKRESNERLLETVQQLRPFYKFSAVDYRYIDDASLALSEGKNGIEEAFEITPESQSIIQGFIEYLQAMPTSYFEIKVNGVLSLDEAIGVIVPDTLSSSTKKFLEQLDIPIIVECSNDLESRLKSALKLSGKGMEIHDSKLKPAKNKPASDVRIKLDQWLAKISDPDLVSFDVRSQEFSLVIAEAIRSTSSFDSRIVVLKGWAAVEVITDCGTAYLSALGPQTPNEIDGTPEDYDSDIHSHLIRESGVSYKLSHLLKDYDLIQNLQSSLKAAHEKTSTYNDPLSDLAAVKQTTHGSTTPRL